MSNAKSYPVERVVEAGLQATQARRLVTLLRSAALAGDSHDPEAFDAAVLRHRRAQRRAKQSLASWATADWISSDRDTRRAA